MFEKLPIGVLLVNGDRIVHHNNKMQDMIGTKICDKQVRLFKNLISSYRNWMTYKFQLLQCSRLM